MADVVIAEEAYGVVLEDSEVPCFIIQWHGFANSQKFRHLMNVALAAYSQKMDKTNVPIGWIADSRQLSALTPADQAWCETDWNPRAYLAGVRFIGIVAPENVFGQIAVQQYVTNVLRSEDYRFETQNLPTLEQTKQWLQEKL